MPKNTYRPSSDRNLWDGESPRDPKDRQPGHNDRPNENSDRRDARGPETNDSRPYSREGYHPGSVKSAEQGFDHMGRMAFGGEKDPAPFGSNDDRGMARNRDKHPAAPNAGRGDHRDDAGTDYQRPENRDYGPNNDAYRNRTDQKFASQNREEQPNRGDRAAHDYFDSDEQRRNLDYRSRNEHNKRGIVNPRPGADSSYRTSDDYGLGTAAYRHRDERDESNDTGSRHQGSTWANQATSDREGAMTWTASSTDWRDQPALRQNRGGDYNGPWASEQRAQRPATSLHRGKGPKGYTRSDDRIREEVCERLMDHDEIDATHIDVGVNNGEIVLTGTVDDRRTKRLAEDVAHEVKGVHDVQNQIKVAKSGRDDVKTAGSNVQEKAGHQPNQSTGGHQGTFATPDNSNAGAGNNLENVPAGDDPSKKKASTDSNRPEDLGAGSRKSKANA